MAKEIAKTKADDLKGKTSDELSALLLELSRKRLNMRFQKAGGQLENTSEIRKVRRAIARVKTFLSEKAQAGKATK